LLRVGCAAARGRAKERQPRVPATMSIEGLEWFTSKSVLLGAGGFEALWGAYMLCCTSSALTAAVGRYLRVGATDASPALVPALSYAGGLRLSMAAFIIVAASTPGGSSELIHRLIVVAVAHTCVLQPFVAACRSAARIPSGCWMMVSLIEGGLLATSLAADVGFDPDVLVKLPAFEASAACVLVGLLLALWAAGAACCCGGMGKDQGGGGLQLADGSLSAPLFDDNRHQLSPASKRLLS